MTLVEMMICGAIGAVVIIGVTSATMTGCSDDHSEAIRTLETNGFTDNVIHDHGYWAGFHGCDGKDGAWYDATSTNPIGKTVNIVVCCGGPLSFKGCTVRVK